MCLLLKILELDVTRIMSIRLILFLIILSTGCRDEKTQSPDKYLCALIKELDCGSFNIISQENCKFTIGKSLHSDIKQPKDLSFSAFDYSSFYENRVNYNSSEFQFNKSRFNFDIEFVTTDSILKSKNNLILNNFHYQMKKNDDDYSFSLLFSIPLISVFNNKESAIIRVDRFYEYPYEGQYFLIEFNNKKSTVTRLIADHRIVKFY